MPGITPNYQHHRQTTGNHTRWLDQRELNQPQLADRISALASNPGAHSGNQGQQANALALLQLFTLLSAVVNRNPQPVISAAKADGRPFSDTLSLAGHLQQAVSAENPFSTLYKSLSHAVVQAGQFISAHDPLTFPAADARPQTGKYFVGKEQDERIVVEDIYGTMAELSRDYYDVQNKTTPYNFIKAGQKKLDDYYKNYYSHYPNLKTLANSIVKEYLLKNYAIDINPDDYYFMHFNSIEYEGRRKLQFGPPDIQRSLTECLFSNFNAHIQDNLPDMDAMCGIYHKSMINNKKFDADSALAISPDNFINAVWKIDFYQHAVAAINTFFTHSEIHIKKTSLDFIEHMNTAKLVNDAAKDVLNGVNFFNDLDIAVSLFDIDGYSAANAFVFENKNTGRNTLYFPLSDFKFKTFDNDIQMRTWVTDACADKEFRQMIEKHFTLADRQDGVFYSGVDSWVNSIAVDRRYYDKIARKPSFIEPKDFFSHYVNKIKEKMLADADTVIKSDSEITRDMWEDGFDAVNELFFNPLTGSASLALHIEHEADGDNLDEKISELAKLKADAVNIVTLVAFSAVSKLSQVEGYEFIESVKKGISSEMTRRNIKFSEMEEVYASESLTSFDKEEMLNQILFGENPELAAAEASLDDALPPNDQVSLDIADSSAGERPQTVAENIYADNPFKHIPHPNSPFTLDEILELDDLKPFAKESDGADTAQQTNQDAAGSSGVLAKQPPAQAAAGISKVALSKIRDFVPIRDIPHMKNIQGFDQILANHISEKLLHHPWDLYMGFNDGNNAYIPQYMRLARSIVKMHLKAAESMLSKVRNNLSAPEMQDDINSYFQRSLATNDKIIIGSAVHRFRLQTQRVMNFLFDMRQAEYNNIAIISTRQDLVSDPSWGMTYKYHSTIQDIDYLKTLSKSFIAKGDPFRRIFILYDTIPEFNVRGIDTFGRPRNNMESVFLHELSHLGSDTKDFFPNELNPTTFELGSAETLQKVFKRFMDSGTFIYSEEFRDFIETFCKFHKLPIPASNEQIINLLRNSPMLQANIIMENADNFVAYVKDISKMENKDQLKVRKPRKKKKVSKKDNNISIGNKPGTSGARMSNQIMKREISDAELELSEKLNAITFIS